MSVRDSKRGSPCSEVYELRNMQLKEREIEIMEEKC